MTTICQYRKYVIAVTLLPLAVLADTGLRHDAFARPSLASLTPQKSLGATPTPEAAATWAPHLTVLMVAGKQSMATVDGTTVKIGEEVAGYRLLRVMEGTAVFIKGDQVVALTMDALSGRPAARRSAP